MLVEVVARLRVLGSDLTDVEVKSAAGGMPESINATLSALANTPGGGLVLLGLDESSGFRPVGLGDPAGLAASLATRGRSFHPPVRFEELGPVQFEGAEVVVARVAECPASAKPCRAPDGRAYLRSFDGDYPLSVVEEQGFLASRGTPVFDRQPVAGATGNDLDEFSLAAWAARVGTSGSALARFAGDELLRRAGIIDQAGTPTVAGMLGFGKFPQQWFPRFIINAGVQSPAAGDGVRLADHEVIDGPIPVMLDRAMAWAERTFTRALHQDPVTGMVTDRRAFPMIAFREIMSNALVHRDLADWSTGQAIEVRITDRGALVVTNPGGLYGITADRLGAEHVTSARNPVLVRLAETLTTPTGGRVIEGLATGIPAIQASLTESGMPPARFSDSGIRFTVLLEPTARPANPIGIAAPADSPSTQAVLAALATGEHPIDWITDHTGLSAANARRILRRLRADGRIIQTGGRGQPTTYRRPG